MEEVLQRGGERGVCVCVREREYCRRWEGGGAITMSLLFALRLELKVCDEWAGGLQDFISLGAAQYSL